MKNPGSMKPEPGMYRPPVEAGENFERDRLYLPSLFRILQVYTGIVSYTVRFIEFCSFQHSFRRFYFIYFQ